MKRFLFSILAIATIGTLSLVGWHFWPLLRFRIALAGLSVNAGGVPTYRGVSQGSFSVNTFSDDLASVEIGDLYSAACTRLEHIRGSFPRRTYHWYDWERWNRVTSVVQFPSGYIAITAANNNDNDSVDVDVMPGTFPPPAEPGHPLIDLIPTNTGNA